jgi:hypothetical protein
MNSTEAVSNLNDNIRKQEAGNIYSLFIFCFGQTKEKKGVF